jgi:hypothetical protein
MSQFGTCCICERAEGVTNILMLDQRAPIPGHGWGCVVCGLPSDGAVAVLCDACLDLYAKQHDALRFVCRGYPGHEGRVPISELSPEPFTHDEAKHRDEMRT